VQQQEPELLLLERLDKAPQLEQELRRLLVIQLRLDKAPQPELVRLLLLD
jgi:hypothetical protein